MSSELGAPHAGASRPEADAGLAAERALVARVAAGDERALAELYDRFAGTAFALAKSITRDDADAEEVVALTFGQVWQSAARFDAARSAPGGWIAMIARSRALDLVRSRRRRARTAESAASGDDDGFALPVGAFPAPDDEVERTETRAMVARELASLPAAQRQVIELAFFGGLSHSDIAAELRQPLGTVKTRMRSGMEKLRLALTPLLRSAGT